MKILILGSALLSVLTLFMPAEALTAPKAPLHRIHADNPKELRELFAYSDERMPLVSAHRGGAVPGYPENCIATFEHTLESAYSMLEIDLRYTKDGHLVLHHDPTLNRTTTGTGPVENLGTTLNSFESFLREVACHRHRHHRNRPADSGQ